MSSKNRKRFIESIWSLPWEDPIHWGECLEAVYNDDTGLPARYLRTAECIARRSTADGSHIVIKKPRGKPPAQSRWQSLLVGEHHGMKMLGLKVERKRREI